MAYFEKQLIVASGQIRSDHRAWLFSMDLFVLGPRHTHMQIRDAKGSHDGGVDLHGGGCAFLSYF
jgi:hypothetical protein